MCEPPLIEPPEYVYVDEYDDICDESRGCTYEEDYADPLPWSSRMAWFCRTHGEVPRVPMDQPF